MKRIISKASVSRERIAAESKAKEHNFRPQICPKSELILAENKEKKVEMKGYQRLYKEAQHR